MVPLPTDAVTWVDELIVKLLTGVPPMVTDLMSDKFVPVITTVPEFAQPLVGVKLVIVGRGV